MVRQAKPENRAQHVGVGSSSGFYLQRTLYIAKYFHKYFICSFGYDPVEKVPSPKVTDKEEKTLRSEVACLYNLAS